MNTSKKSVWLVPFLSSLLGILVLFTIGVSVLLAIAVDELDKYEARGGEVDWVGRVVTRDAEDYNGRIVPTKFYELASIDAYGREEVVFEQELGPFGDDISWHVSDSYDGSEYLTLEMLIGGSEGSYTQQVSFKNKEELVRTTFGTGWGGTQNLSVETPEETYLVELEYEGSCGLSEAELQARRLGDYGQEKSVILENIVVSTESGYEEKFEVTGRPSIECIDVDGYPYAQHVSQIHTYNSGIGFTLPDGRYSWITFENGLVSGLEISQFSE